MTEAQSGVCEKKKKKKIAFFIVITFWTEMIRTVINTILKQLKIRAKIAHLCAFDIVLLTFPLYLT